MDKWEIKTTNVECYWRERKEDGDCKATGITCQENLCPLAIDICKDREGFWINGITKELSYRQRIIGVIHVEDGEIVNTKNSKKES